MFHQIRRVEYISSWAAAAAQHVLILVLWKEISLASLKLRNIFTKPIWTNFNIQLLRPRIRFINKGLFDSLVHNNSVVGVGWKAAAVEDVALLTEDEAFLFLYDIG